MSNLICASFLGMPSVVDFWLSMFLVLLNAVLCAFMSTKLLHILQLSGYKTKGCIDWLKQTKFNYWGRLLIISVLSIAAMIITNVLLDQLFVVNALRYVSVLFYFLFACVYIINTYSVKQKTQIKYTSRMTRLVIAVSIISALVTAGLLYVTVNTVNYFTAGGVTIVPVLLPLIVYLAHLLTSVVEKQIAKHYVNKAKERLSKHTDIKVIGITGSYGKTSVKNMIATILASKYKVCVTPFSYNTPLGLSKTILENLEDADQVLVAEMGARNVGDIAELCNMVRPTIGVITGIGNQHMATFGSQENLIKTKGELVEYVTSQNGVMIFNTDSPDAKTMYYNANCEKFEVGLNANQDVFAKDIVCTKEGSTFTLIINGEKIKNVKTALLGEHNISNVLVAVSVAKQLGLSNKEIADGISKLIPTAHRLAIVPSTNALVVIDDAYNGSVEGAKSALNVLSKFDTNKVVITPGLVELGKDQFNSNFEFGRELSKVANYVIITSTINYDAIASGLEFCNFEKTHIIRAGNLSQAVTMLASITNPGDVVLFENDLPDNYL